MARTVSADLLADLTSPTESRRTLVALFDDTIDTELVLMALRKSDAASETISVILRERLAAEIAQKQGSTSLLSRVVASSALDVVGSWLQGLASLILPDRASYLVAGPIGVFLATIRESRGSADAGTRQLARALLAFGFGHDEASYLEHRVVAGSPLLAITSNDVEMLRRALAIFARSAAVYIGLARTDSAIDAAASRRSHVLDPPPDRGCLLLPRSGGQPPVTILVCS